MITERTHKDEINEILEKYGPNGDINRMLDDLKSYFVEQCEPGRELDPRPTENNYDGNAPLTSWLYWQVAIRLTDYGRKFAALELLLHGWNLLNRIQTETGRKIYKGAMAIYTTKFYYDYLHDLGAAARWALLTHADDSLVGHETGEGAWWLRYSFNMSKEALSEFGKIISEPKLNRNESVWSQAEGFADDKVRRFALEHPQYSHLFTLPTSVLEFAPCIPYLERLHEQADRNDLPSSTDKGNALEYLASYLFLLIPGFLPRRKVIQETSHVEYDLVVSNLRPSGNLEAELFGRDFLVECKNWQDDKVGVDKVGYFLYRMRLTHTKFGVIFARKGITGHTEKRAYAENLLQRAFHEDGALCIIIKNSDIKDIVTEKTTFRSLLMEKTNQLRFGKPNKIRRNRLPGP